MNGSVASGGNRSRPRFELASILRWLGSSAAAIKYHDFTLLLRPQPDGRCEVGVLQSLSGDAEESVTLPDIGEELGQIFAGLRHARASQGGQKDDGAADSRDRFRTVGKKLFDALFPGAVRLRWEESKARLERKHGLRLKIRLNLERPESVRLHALPWEYLFNGSFVGLDRHYPIVRYIESPKPAELPPCPHPLRILLVLSRPSGLPKLPALEAEARGLEEIGRNSKALDIVRLEAPTLDALGDALRQGAFHVLHFMGHGDFHEGAGVLFFEDGKRRPAAVRGEDLAVHLQGTSLRMVFLNACETARAAMSAPFAGVASAVVRADIPAVVAMQFPVTDWAALMFAKEVYRRIAAGDPVDAAVTDGRLALHRKAPDSMEWGTPALFLRAPDGRLFKPNPVARWLRIGLVLFAILVVAVASWSLLPKRPANSVRIEMVEEGAANTATAMKIRVDDSDPHIISGYNGEAILLGEDPPEEAGSIRVLHPIHGGECVKISVEGAGGGVIAKAARRVEMPPTGKPVFEIQIEQSAYALDENECL